MSPLQSLASGWLPLAFWTKPAMLNVVAVADALPIFNFDFAFLALTVAAAPQLFRELAWLATNEKVPAAATTTTATNGKSRCETPRLLSFCNL